MFGVEVIGVFRCAYKIILTLHIVKNDESNDKFFPRVRKNSLSNTLDIINFLSFSENQSFNDNVFPCVIF